MSGESAASQAAQVIGDKLSYAAAGIATGGGIVGSLIDYQSVASFASICIGALLALILVIRNLVGLAKDVRNFDSIEK